MRTFIVTIPYLERQIGKEAKARKASLRIEADAPMEALKTAINEFQATTENPHASWTIQIEEDGVNAWEKETGERFRLTEEARTEPQQKEEEKLLTMEEYLRQMESDPQERLDLYQKALKILAETGGSKNILPELLKIIMQGLKAEAGSILALDPSKEELFFKSAIGPKARDVLKFRIPLEKGLAGYCAKSGKAFAVSDVRKDPRFFEEVSKNVGYETRSILAAPIRLEGRTSGVLELINQIPNDRFSSGDIETARHLASLIGLILLRD